jgi:predicted dehydrogenase
VSARGECYLQPGIEDVVFGYVRFGSGAMAHLHVSWLDPHKRRMLTVVGTEAMAVFDDTEADRKLTVYEKTAWPARFDTWGEFQALQSGDIHIPRITADEPLQLEMRAFVDAVRTGTTPIASGAEGLAVVRTLAALQESLDDGGRPVTVDA